MLALTGIALTWGNLPVSTWAQSPSGPLSLEQLDKLPKRLSQLKDEEFAQWVVGTEWEYENDGKARTIWFVTPTSQIWTEEKGTSKQRCLGYTTTKGTMLSYYDASERKVPRLVTVNEDLQSATMDSIGAKRPMRLLGRRFPKPLEMRMTLPEFEEWMKVRTLRSDNKVWFGEDGYLRWNSDKDKARYSFPGPGLVECEWNNPWNRSLVILDPNMKTYRWFSGWGTDSGRIESPNLSSTVTSSSVSGSSAIPIKKRVSSVGGLLVVPLGSSRYVGKTSKLSITALKMEKDAPATIGFNQEVGESMGKALKEVSKYQVLRHDGWPRGHRMEIFFEDKYSPKDGPSAAVACALLVESLITGVELDPGFSVTGDLNADGSVQPIGGVIAKLRGATKGGQKIAAIPQKNRTSALDLAVGEGTTPFVGLQLFSVDTFDEALALARTDRAPALAESITTFAAVSETLKSSPGLLTTPGVRESLARVLTSAPNHVSARLLLAMAEGRLPGQFSASGSLEAVDQAVASIREATDTDLSATSSLDSGKLSASRNRLQRLRGMVDSRVQPYVDAWLTWASLADQMISRRSATPQVIKQFKSAGSRINAEAKKLEGNSEFMEEVLR